MSRNEKELQFRWFYYSFRFSDLPIFIIPGFLCIHIGKARPIKREVPIMNRFREESRETFLRLEIPMAVIIPIKRMKK